MTILTEYQLSSDEQQGFDGNMLGDGCIVYKNKTCKAPRYIHYSKHPSYLSWLSTNLSYLENRPIWNKTYKDNRTHKVYECYWMGTKSGMFFRKQRERWYVGSKKILPKDLIVDKRLLLHWYLDDGSKATKGGLYFAADDLTFEEVSELKSKIDVYTNLTVGIHSNQGNPRIYIRKKDVKDFYSIIGDCTVSSFAYKW